MPQARTEECPRWIRAYKDGELVVDSRRARYAWPSRGVLSYAFPPEDVQLERVEVRRIEGDLVVPTWDQMDQWLEEDDPVIGHPRDPYVRVDARRSSRRVVVTWNGEVVAESSRPVIVFETGLAPRYYLPRPDVRLSRLDPSSTRTICPYKGVASYWSLVRGGDRLDDGVWSYEHPYPALALIEGLLCFYQERVELTLDGEPVRGPHPLI